MNDQTENEEQKKQSEPKITAAKPPIFFVYEFLQERPILLGTLSGALVGAIVAAQADLPGRAAIIGGALIGTVVAAVILRLR